LSVPPEKMLSAFDIVTKEQVKRIARNEKGAQA
jgi:hypothetical protein